MYICAQSIGLEITKKFFFLEKSLTKKKIDPIVL